MARGAHSLYTASARVLRPALDTLRMLGHDPAPLLDRLGLEEGELADDDRRIPQDIVVALWDGARDESGDDAFGLTALGTLSSRRRTLSDYVLLNAPTLGALIERGLRYERLWQEGREASLSVEGETAVLRWRARPGLCFSPPLVEFGLAALTRLSRHAVRGQGGPGEVWFAHAPPRDVEAYEAVFHGRVRFSAPEYAIHFPARDLELAVPEADPALLEVLERHAAQALERLPRASSFGHAVREALAGELPGGRPTLARIAKRLRTSPRTLRRRLAEEDLTFQKLLDDLRHELALRYLADPALSVTETAFLLGFADGAAFSNAFRRWTGTSPVEHRRAHRRDVSS